MTVILLRHGRSTSNTAHSLAGYTAAGTTRASGQPFSGVSLPVEIPLQARRIRTALL